MSNTIDASLYPELYKRAYKVARKKYGILGGVLVNFGSDSVNIGKAGEDKTYVTIPIAGAPTNRSFTAAQTATVGANSTHTMRQVQITKSESYSWHQTDDEVAAMGIGGNDNVKDVFMQEVEIAMDGLMDLVSEDVVTDLPKWCSYARGVAGTTPFAADLSPLTACWRELNENGAPEEGRSFVMNHAASENFMNLAAVQQVNVSGSDAALRSGIMLPHYGFRIALDTNLDAVTKGTATGYDANGGEPIAETTIVCDGSSTGTILAGDVITWAGDATKYVVADTTQSLSGGAAGNIVINSPGLKATLATTVEGTTGANYTPSLAVQKNGYVVVMRPPSISANTTTVKSVTPITDASTGLTFFLVELPGYGLTTWELHLAWGFQGLNPAFNILYLG